MDDEELNEKLRFRIRPSGLKKCSNCKKEKALNLFHKCKPNWDGMENVCKACRKAIDATRPLR